MRIPETNLAGRTAAFRVRRTLLSPFRPKHLATPRDIVTNYARRNGIEDEIGETEIVVTLDRRCHNPILREAALDQNAAPNPGREANASDSPSPETLQSVTNFDPAEIGGQGCPGACSAASGLPRDSGCGARYDLRRLIRTSSGSSSRSGCHERNSSGAA